jgi:hypothetical protein
MRLTVEQIAMRRRPGLMVWEQDYIDTIDALCAERDAAVTQFAQDAAQEIRTGGVYRLEHPAMPMIRDAIAAERDAARGEALLLAGDWFLNWCDRAGVKVEESAIRQGLAYLPGQEALCGTAVNVDISTNAATRPTAKDASHSEERPLLPDQEWKKLSLESQNKVRKWFDLAAKYLQAILDERIDPDILALDPSAVKR